MTYDTVIIGSGVSGLAAALLLAKKGQKVLLLEKASRPAPVVSGFTRRNIHCETGFHFTGMLAPGLPLHRFLHYLGVIDDIHPLSMPEYDGWQIVFSGRRRLNLPWGREALRDCLAARFPGEARGVSDYIRQIHQEVINTPIFIMQDDAANLNKQKNSGTLAACLQQSVKNQELQAALSLRCALHGVAPEDVLFSLHARVEGGFQLSSHSIRGGGVALVNALINKLKQYGGEIAANAEVERIVVENRIMRGVQLSQGDYIAGKACIFTAHPALLPGMLPPGTLRPTYTKRLLSLPETGAPFIVYGVLNASRSKLLANRVFFVCAHDSIGHSMRETDPHKAMMCISIAPAQSSNISQISIISRVPEQVFTACGDAVDRPRSSYYLQTKQMLADIFVKRAVSALPELAGALTVLEAATPLTFGQYANNPKCGIYGVYHSVDTQWLHPLTSIKGLLLAGQSVLLPGILGAMVSAFLAGGILTGLEQIIGDLSTCYGDA
jgi:all-trans-retinol 13,14-reductase